MVPGMPRVQAQLRLLGLHGLLTYPFACVPFLFFYFQERGIEVAGYTQLIAWYYWAMVVCEVPTGLFADRFGRQPALVLGSALLAAGFCLLALGDGFAWFALGQVVLGVGHSLLSGPPTALLHDSLREAGEEDRFIQVESRIHAGRLLGTGLSFLLGGILAQLFGLTSTIWVTAGLCAAASACAHRLREPPRDQRPRGPALVRAAALDLKQPALLWILVYFITLFFLLRFCFHTYQPYFAETVRSQVAEYQYLILGGLFFALNLLAAPASRLSPRLANGRRAQLILTLLPLTLAASFLLMAGLPSWLGIAMFCFHQVPFGLHWGLVQHFVNRRIGDQARATVLSVLSFAGRTAFALVLPFLGQMQESRGTPAVYGVVGVAGVLLTLVWCSPLLGGRLLNRDPECSAPDPGPGPPGGAAA